MKIGQYYLITVYSENDKTDPIICNEFSISKTNIIVYDGLEEYVFKRNASKIKIEHVAIINGKKISDENYIYFN